MNNRVCFEENLLNIYDIYREKLTWPDFPFFWIFWGGNHSAQLRGFPPLQPPCPFSPANSRRAEGTCGVFGFPFQREQKPGPFACAHGAFCSRNALSVERRPGPKPFTQERASEIIPYQITYLLFMKRLDDVDKKKQADAERTKEAYVSAFLTRTTRTNHARKIDATFLKTSRTIR
jgi:hypothetical protein